jgi:hypothetical protein
MLSDVMGGKYPEKNVERISGRIYQRVDFVIFDTSTILSILLQLSAGDKYHGRIIGSFRRNGELGRNGERTLFILFILLMSS